MADILKEKNKIALICIVMLLAYFYFINPMLIKECARKKIILRKTRNEYLLISKRINGYNDTIIEYNSLKNKISDLKKSIIYQSDATVVGKRLNDLADVYGVSISKLSFGETKKINGYYILSINMDISGEFFRIGDFIGKMENSFTNVDWNVNKMASKENKKISGNFVLYVRQYEG